MAETFLGKTYEAKPRPGSNYAESLQDFQIRTAEESDVKGKLGVTAAQLITNPGLSSDPNSLSKYTGVNLQEAQRRIGLLGGVSAPAGRAGSFADLETQATATEKASGLNVAPGGIGQQPKSFQEIQQGILQTAQSMADLSGQQGVPLASQFQQQFPDISKRFEEAHQKTKETGITAPTDSTGAKEMFDTFLQDKKSTAIQDFVSQDPYLNATMTSYQKYMDSLNQRASLVDTYKTMLSESGIQQIDTDLLNMKNIIEGTEDDIRTEVTKAGGFATESQVVALSNARNKQLIKNYNTLLETRNSKESYLNTMMNLTAQDRQAVDQQFETQMNFGFKIAEINQTMKQNSISTLDRVAKTLGWDGIWNATQGNPQLQRQIETTYGLPQGGLAIAAQRDAEARATAQQESKFGMQLDLAKFEEQKRQFGLDYALQQQKLAQDKAGAGGLNNAQMNSTINQITGAFDNEQIVKDFNAATSQYQLMNNLGTQGKSPGDDIAFVYAFAKLMDPNSVVREGEYATIQKYAQSFLDAKTLEAVRLAKNTNFLSADAKQKLLTTSYAKMQVLNTQYQSLQNQYQQRINTVQGGGFNTLPNYSQAFNLQSPGTITPENQSKLEKIEQETQQIEPGQTGSKGAVNIAKNLWNWLTTSWMPKIK